MNTKLDNLMAVGITKREKKKQREERKNREEKGGKSFIFYWIKLHSIYDQLIELLLFGMFFFFSTEATSE